jgi:5-methylcytosine-specific restriction endonuclease McrA
LTFGRGAAGRDPYYCSRQCELAFRRARYVHVRFIYSCEICSHLFTTNQSLQKRCSEHIDLGARLRTAKRRVIRSAAMRGHHVDRLAILERDRWRCRLCGQPIDRSLPGRHPLSASVDHIVPISQGGPHTEENMQAAHLCCNSAKGPHLAVA